MRLAVHDYSGHPFQVQLSRELARRGHEVLHLHFESFPTPKGGVCRRPDDPASFQVEGLRLDEPFSKYGDFLHRRSQEIHYGRMAAARIAKFRPDAVLSANTPLDAQQIVQAEARRIGARFVFWLQDIYSEGISAYLRKKKLPLARAIGLRYRRLEQSLVCASDAVVAISRDFTPHLESWGVARDRLHVIENWAPVDELQPCPQDNPWSRTHGLAGKFVYLYSGTIGLKHDPALLLHLARDPEAAVVVISEGVKAQWLEREAAARRLANVKVLPLQPWELMPEVLGSASVLTAILDEEAGAFSVPSKVLSYLCAGRPLLLSVPSRNRAARLVRENACGVVAPPNDSDAFEAAAALLRASADLRAHCARNAASYARREFDIRAIAPRFCSILNTAPDAAGDAHAEPARRRFLAMGR